MTKKYLQLNDIDAYKRSIIFFGELQKLPKELNQLIQFTNQKLAI